MPKYFSVVNPPRVVWCTSCTDHSVPIRGLGMPAVHCTAVILVHSCFKHVL